MNSRLGFLGLVIALLIAALWWGLSKPTTEETLASPETAQASDSRPEATPSTALIGDEDSQHRKSVDPGSAVEVQSVEASTSVREKAFVFVKLVDRSTGLPVEGAVLYRSPGHMPLRISNEPWKNPKPWIPEGTKIATSDSGGVLSVEQIPSRSAIYEVHADGFSPVWLGQEPPQTKEPGPRKVLLAETATLYGYISGPIPGGFANVSIGAYSNFFNASLQGRLHTRTWIAPCDVTGSFELKGLPSTEDLHIWIDSTDPETETSEVLHRPRETLSMKPGENRRMDWTYKLGHRLQGFALTSAGAPKSKYTIWAVSKSETETEERLQYHNSPIKKVKTDALGFFQFEDLPAGRYLVGPRPAQFGPAPHGVYVHVPTDEALLIQDPTMGVVQGKVFFEGRPLAGMLVQGGDGSQPAISGKDGGFSVPCAQGKSIRVTCVGGMGSQPSFSFSDGTLATEGDRNVRIEMTRAASLELSAVESQTEKLVLAAFSLVLSDGRQGPYRTTLCASPYKPIGLSPGRYVAYAVSVDGQCARSEPLDLRSPSDHNEAQIVLHLAPGGKITLAGLLRDETAILSFSQGGNRVLQFRVNPKESSFWIPPGDYGVEINHQEKASTLSTDRVSIRAGEQMELTISR